MCLPAAIDEDDDETLKRAIAMSLQEDPPTIKVENSEDFDKYHVCGLITK